MQKNLDYKNQHPEFDDSPDGVKESLKLFADTKSWKFDAEDKIMWEEINKDGAVYETPFYPGTKFKVNMQSDPRQFRKSWEEAKDGDDEEGNKRKEIMR